AYRERLARIAGRSAETFARRSFGGVRAVTDGARRLQPSVQRDGALITLANGDLTLVLNARRGLAIQSLTFASAGTESLLGTLKHGYYDDIHWGADFYSAMLVFESPGHPKLTDLNRVEPAIRQDEDGSLIAEAVQATDLGAMTKTFRV